MGENLSTVNYSSGTEEVLIDGGIRKPHIATWPFYSLSLFSNGAYKVTWTAFFPGQVSKNSAGDFWKWDNIGLDKVKASGATAPCFSFEMDATISKPLISPDRKTAVTGVDFTVLISIPCAIGVEYDTKSGSYSGQQLKAE